MERPDNPITNTLSGATALYERERTKPSNGNTFAKSYNASGRPSKKKIKSHRKSAEHHASPMQDQTVSASMPAEDQVVRSKDNKDAVSGRGGVQAEHITSSAMSPYITTPKKTPVPLPQKPSNIRTTVSVVTSPPKQDAEVLVAETPPSRLSLPSSQTWKTPIRPTQTPVPAPSFATTKPKPTTNTLKLFKSAVSHKTTEAMYKPRTQTLLTVSTISPKSPSKTSLDPNVIYARAPSPAPRP